MIKGEKYNLRKSWVNFCQQKYIFWVDKGICLKDTQKKGFAVCQRYFLSDQKFHRIQSKLIYSDYILCDCIRDKFGLKLSLPYVRLMKRKEFKEYNRWQ